MQSFHRKLNIWQEVRSIESSSQPKEAKLAQEENQVPQETWFQLLQYPAQIEQEPMNE